MVESLNLTKPTAFLHVEQNIPALLERLVNEAGYNVQNAPPDQDIIALIERTHADLLVLLVKLDEEPSAVEGLNSAFQALTTILEHTRSDETTP